MHIKHKLRWFAVSVFVAAQTLADGTITQVTAHDDQLHLTIRITPGEHYDLQCTTNLASGVWEDIGSLYSESASVTNITLGTEADHCSFRVLERTTVESAPTSPSPPPPPPPPPNLFP